MDVLVVDDEAFSRRTISHTLREAGYRVVTARDGNEALALLKEQPHQLVVSDWSMPAMNGIELCRAVRAAELRRYVYIIMLTSHNRPQDTIEGLSAGADDYVTKPFNPGELIMRVNTGRRIIELETRGMTVFAMAKLAESRDSETGAHLERVRRYCRVLAQRLQQNPRFGHVVDDEYVRLIYETSPLHDIGKVAIPDAILLKPGKLTAAEFEIMKTHTLRGAETLDSALQEFPNARFLRMAKEIALSHHEKYDGSGYPSGLVGDKIPLCGRIVALADVYDALTSKRVYKSAFSHATATLTILRESGKHFDPEIVETFVAAGNEFSETYSRWSETVESRERPTAIPPSAPAGIAERTNSCN
ncbi:MAG TPA: HD domain-containing phosphohydrolase [Planctomycetaceae bacterium]|jgi:putative two-component system response regulator|nr:HD domain-containing phosphohydrolase [Planctomycetaceae bacterium]